MDLPINNIWPHILAAVWYWCGARGFNTCPASWHCFLPTCKDGFSYVWPQVMINWMRIHIPGGINFALLLKPVTFRYGGIIFTHYDEPGILNAQFNLYGVKSCILYYWSSTMKKSDKLKERLVEAERLLSKDQSNPDIDKKSEKIKNRQKGISQIKKQLADLDSGVVEDMEIGQKSDTKPNSAESPVSAAPKQQQTTSPSGGINWSKSRLELFMFVKTFITHVTLLSGLGVSIELPDSIEVHLLLGLNIKVIKLIANQISEIACKSDDINKVYGQLVSLQGGDIKRSDFKMVIYNHVLGICFAMYWELASCSANEDFSTCGDKSTMVGGQTFIFLDWLRQISQFDGTSIPMFGRFINLSVKLVPIEQLFSRDLCEVLESKQFRQQMRSVNEILIRMLSDKVRFTVSDPKPLSEQPFGGVSFGDGIMWIPNGYVPSELEIGLGYLFSSKFSIPSFDMRNVSCLIPVNTKFLESKIIDSLDILTVKNKESSSLITGGTLADSIGAPSIPYNLADYLQHDQSRYEKVRIDPIETSPVNTYSSSVSYQSLLSNVSDDIVADTVTE